MLICGIDPGLNITAYGLVAETPQGLVLKGTGYVHTSVRDPLPRRLAEIHGTLKRAFARLQPQAIVLEKLYAHYRHPLTASLLGHARGVIAMLAQECGIPYFEYPATRVKKAVTGKGHASKRQVQRMIEHMLGFKAEALGPADITDAIALALTHALVRGRAHRDGHELLPSRGLGSFADPRVPIGDQDRFWSRRRVAEAGRPIRPQRKGSHGGMGGARTDGANAPDRTRRTTKGYHDRAH